MSERDPRRLLDPSSDLDPNLRALLAAGRAELPGHERIVAMARRAGPEFVAPATTPVHVAGGLGVLSLVTLGVLLFGLGGAAHWAMERGRDEAAPAPRPARGPEPLPVARTAEPEVAEAPPPPVSPGLEPPVRAGQPARERARSASSDPVAELTLLDEAQSALRTAPELALDRATTHAARFPHGQYEQEREIIAIEALLLLGRNSAAERRASRFVARFPGSSYRSRADQQRARASAADGARRQPAR